MVDKTQVEGKEGACEELEWLGEPPELPEWEAPDEEPGWLAQEAPDEQAGLCPSTKGHEGAQRTKGDEQAGLCVSTKGHEGAQRTEAHEQAGLDRSTKGHEGARRTEAGERAGLYLSAKDHEGAQGTKGDDRGRSRIEGEEGSLVEPENMPPLPEEAQFDTALGRSAGEWLDRYCEYGLDCSPMTPRLFHESAGLWLASAAVARRLAVPAGKGVQYPNLWVLWLGKTTVWHKTTALNAARDLAQAVFPHLMAAHQSTPEGLLSDLSGREPAHFSELDDASKDRWRQERNFAAQRGLYLDEFAGFMAAANRDYNAGLIESFLRLYDCDDEHRRSTRSMGWVVVKNAYLSIIGATTPGSLKTELGQDRLWNTGWWGRFALLTPDRAKPEFVPNAGEGEPRHKTRLMDELRRLYAALPAARYPAAPETRVVTVTDEADAAWQRYYQALSNTMIGTPDVEERLEGSYGRLPVQALKVALLLAALDWNGRGEGPAVELAHVIRGMTIAESWRASLHRVVDGPRNCDDFEATRGRVLRVAAKHGEEGATLRDLYTAIRNKSPDSLREVLDQMVRLGDVEVVNVKPGPQGGRPATRYRVAGTRLDHD